MWRIAGLGAWGWLYVAATGGAAVSAVALHSIVPYLLLMVLGFPLSLMSHVSFFLVALWLAALLHLDEAPWPVGGGMFVLWWTVSAWGNALLYRATIEAVREAGRRRRAARVTKAQTAF